MNIQEAQIHALIVRSRAMATEVIAMQTHDKYPDVGKYTEESYLTLANELYSISDQIQALARSM